MTEFLGGFGVLLDPHVVVAFLAYYFAMALISGMPEPTATDTRNYRWAYRSLHIFAANVDAVVKNKLGVETVTKEKKLEMNPVTDGVTLTETVTTEKKSGEPPKDGEQ